jgi:hypothetical protein
LKKEGEDDVVGVLIVVFCAYVHISR